MRRLVRALLLVALVLLEVVGWAASVPAQSSSTSSAPTASEADVLALRERVAAFWAARVARDPQRQWELLEPRGKGQVTALEYGAEPAGGRYLAYQVEGATVNGVFAMVKVRVLVQQVLPPSADRRPVPPQAVVVNDGWVRVGGVWYRRLDDRARGPFQAREP